MPMYDYECEACGHRATEFQFMKDPHLTECPQCQADQYRKRPSLPHTDMIAFHTPIEMYSIACDNDAEIEQLQRAVPDLKIETNPESELYGIPIAATRKQKLAALAALGYEEKS